jgi:hypothetical protein
VRLAAFRAERLAFPFGDFYRQGYAFEAQPHVPQTSAGKACLSVRRLFSARLCL